MTTVKSDGRPRFGRSTSTRGRPSPRHGDLVVLESMKTANPVAAALGGMVSAVHVAARDWVCDGDALMDVD